MGIIMARATARIVSWGMADILSYLYQAGRTGKESDESESDGSKK